ncbi:type II secretion system protein GspL [Oceanicoccus sagamiensis]|uniref:Type II secretion system protein L n=1 Tax=Oceanicoccus sagamiensis TaxID=716816 RepID=A0A1X9NG50_9GAMM|nr:type II secretion system protein GspL [Oceanicoccus sagamiensis]ARN74845.1 hypothetical protein BST96_12395 [Oceanicoccus sagamiensis]
MTSTIVIKQCGIDNYEWLAAGKAALPAPQLVVGDGERLAAQCAQAGRVVLLARAENIALKTMPFEKHERKLLRQTIPYALEDDCVNDIEEQHIALGDITANTVALAMIKREQLDQYLAKALPPEVDVHQLVSELLLIPLHENRWSIMVDDDRWLVRSADYDGFALEADVAPFALQLMLDEAEQLPDQISIYCDQEQQSAINAKLPELLRGIADWQYKDYWSVLAEGLSQQAAKPTLINLLQGDYAPSLPWKKWWQTWKVAALLLITAVVFQLVVTYTQLSVLEKNNLALRAEIEQAYRSAVPRGAVMDPERQLRRKVGAMKGASGEGFVSMLSQIGPVLNAVNGLSLQSLNYNEKQSEVRMTILAPRFNDVETARANLEKLGLKAELTGSNAEGDKTRARLRVRG